MTPDSDYTRANEAAFNGPKAVAEYSKLDDLFPVEKDLIARHFPPPPARVLDIGCGAGRTTRRLAEMGYHVIGGDLAPAMVEAARRLHPGLDFRVMDATRLDLPDQTFDVVFFSFNGMDLIYPFSLRLRAMGECFRVLKPGGLFAYSSHNIIARFTGPRRFKLHVHLRQLAGFIYHSVTARSVLQNYWRERLSGEWCTLYCGIPARQIAALRNAGFEFLGMVSSQARTLAGITLRDYAFVNYAARRPGGSANRDAREWA